MNFAKITALAVAILFTACSNTVPPEVSEAKYQVTLHTYWNGKDFPISYPSNAHFSPLIGATHNKNVNFWDRGKVASDGIKQVAETGKTGDFSVEINNAIKAKTAQYLIKKSGVSAQGTIQTTIGTNKDFPLVTVLTMIAPSPDWFIGVHDISLLDNNTNKFKDKIEIDLKLYDAGTDDGEKFKSDNSKTTPPMGASILDTNGATDFQGGVHSQTGKFVGKIIFLKI